MNIHVNFQLSGKVQGVGFRPFVYALAHQLNLQGYTLNSEQGLDIYLYGSQASISAFEHTLNNAPPRHAYISKLSKKILKHAPSPAYKNFDVRYQDTIDRKSAKTKDEDRRHPILLTPPADRALCKRCLVELFDPKNKRFLYPFINCIECGPRASIIHALPYERLHTAYRSFTACQHCTHESSHLTETQHQRFHSQTNSCWQCGPSLSLFHKETLILDSQANTYHQYFDLLAQAIHAGKIIALKGIGGFHLLCDARNPDAIHSLRSFKQRPDKPFAVMGLNIPSLKTLVNIDQPTECLLTSTAAPIVLSPKSDRLNPLSEQLAPAINDLGCMLPYTALHYLLFHALLNQPQGDAWLSERQAPLLAVTSANAPGEPIISHNEQCIQTTANIAEYSLCHDRDIYLSSDDSVIQSPDAMMIRRARGYAPEPVSFPHTGKAVLAFGAHMKHTFCLSDGRQAFLSPHLASLNSIANYERLDDILTKYLSILPIQPKLLVCDTHPDLASTRFAEDYAQTHSLPLMKVPHHQAHLAATLVNTHLPVNTTFIGLALDGIGLGESSHQAHTELWGGELFLGNIRNGVPSFQHLAQLSSLSLPGGDKANKEIGRIGYALWNTLKRTYTSNFKVDFALPPELKTLIDQNADSFPRTSALGRWFDALSSLLGIRQIVSYEAQAAIELETMAAHYSIPLKCRHLANIDQHGNLELHPILPAVISAQSVQEGAAIFHTELIEGLLRWSINAAQQHNTQHIVCSGGCFQNKQLKHTLTKRLSEKGFIVHNATHIPMNDAGISLGQAFIASTQTHA